MDKVARFRVSEDDRLLLQRAAKRSGRKFSDWARLVLVDAASTGEVARPQHRVHTPDDAGSIPAAATKSADEISPGEMAKQVDAVAAKVAAREKLPPVVLRREIPKPERKR